MGKRGHHSGQTAIVGAASTGFSKLATQTPVQMASDVVAAALADAGIERSEVDGLAVHIGSPRGTDYDLVASLLGLQVRFSAQPWSHGRFAASLIQQAAMALTWGMADCIVCVASYNNTAYGRHGVATRPNFHENLREGGGPHGEAPHTGFSAPVIGAAMASQRYFHQYGVTPEKLSTVALTQRRHAQLNPDAAKRDDLSLEQYLNARYIAEPLRLFDCSVVVDGAAAIVMTRSDRARDTRSKPVYLLGAQGIHAGTDEYIFGQPGLGVNQSFVHDRPGAGANHHVYEMAGVTPQDIDTLHIYDAFSPCVLWTLERFGFCARGQAADWIQGGRIGLGGELPVNTSGGFLSEGQLNGWGQMIEIVRQLRGQANARQIADVELAQWATSIGDSIIFGKHA